MHAVVESKPAVLVPGSLFAGRYEVVRSLQSGGMGAVYEVADQATRRRRALKVLLPSVVADPDIRARFNLEAIVVADVTSEHIVEIFDAGVDADTGAPFLVMELLRGEDLNKLLSRRGTMSPEEVVELTRQTARALDKTAAVGVVHRDIKPGNLFVTERDDGGPRVKVLDFGIAKIVFEGTSTAPDTVPFGTPLYMAPEQIRGEGDIDPRADLYSLGHVAYALLVGKAYFREESRAGHVFSLLLTIEKGAPEPATIRAAREGVDLPPAFDAWFSRATAPLPHDRFSTGAEMVDALATALGVATARPRLPSVAPAVSAQPAREVTSATLPAEATSQADASTTSKPTTTTAAVRPPPATGWLRSPRALAAAAALAVGAGLGLLWTFRPQAGAGVLAPTPAAPRDPESLAGGTVADGSHTVSIRSPQGGSPSVLSSATQPPPETSSAPGVGSEKPQKQAPPRTPGRPAAPGSNSGPGTTTATTAGPGAAVSSVPPTSTPTTTPSMPPLPPSPN